MGVEETPTSSAVDRQQVSDTLISLISRLLDRTIEVHAETELEGDLGLDSIGRAELSAQISTMYGISVVVDDLDEVDTFGELLDTVVAAATEQPG